MYAAGSLTSELYAKNGESTDIEEPEGAAEAREGRAEGVRPLPQRVLVLVVVLATVVAPVDVSLPLAYPESEIPQFARNYE